MIEKRKSHRVKLSTRTILSQNDILHYGKLENISKSGALVRLLPGTHVPKGAEYDLTIYLDGEEFPLQFSAELMNIAFGMAGIKFVAYNSETEARLDALMEMLSSEVDIAMVEHEKYLRRLAVDSREG